MGATITYTNTDPTNDDTTFLTLQKQLAVLNGGVIAASSGNVFQGSYGDPNGDVTATRPAIYYDANGGVWVKTGAGTNNTGWEQIIS